MSGASIECGVPVRQLRGYVCMVTFTCFFLYLLSGVYVPSSSEDPGARGRLGRQLLWSTLGEQENASNGSCSGLDIGDQPVDLASAHVCYLPYFFEISPLLIRCPLDILPYIAPYPCFAYTSLENVKSGTSFSIPLHLVCSVSFSCTCMYTMLL